MFVCLLLLFTFMFCSEFNFCTHCVKDIREFELYFSKFENIYYI